MSKSILIESPAPPAVVLASIRHLAGEWRESKIPPELRADRVLSIEGWVEGTKFRFAYMRRWYWQGESELNVSGHVRPRPDGGSIVDVRCGTITWAYLLLSLPGTVAAIWLLHGNWLEWVWIPMVVAMFVSVWMQNARISRETNPQADYLVRRIEAAVAAAGSASRPST